MPLGFDHRAVRITAVIIFDRFAGRWIGEAESEPRGQRRLPLRIDFLNVNSAGCRSATQGNCGGLSQNFRLGPELCNPEIFGGLKAVAISFASRPKGSVSR